ncbi:MAG: CBS domain-containing protein [Bacillota bacterium]|jgi:CBS domain-containing protein
MKAKDIMNKEVITVDGSATIKEIAQIFVDNRISGVPVVDGDKLIGIVTEGDLMHKKTSPRAPSVLSILGAVFYVEGVHRYREDFAKLLAMNAEDIMSKDVVTIPEHMPVNEIATIFVKKDINRAPVLRNDKIIGIVSREDIVKSLLLEDL